MQTDAVATLIRDGIPGSQVEVRGDGSHFDAVVVSDRFAGKSLIERQRLVMATVKPQIESGELHAISIKTYTPEQWAGEGA